ncbi:MAG: ParB/RepB/Spo0J family partition protein [Spirochaetes bacterium]|nr:ParB/RepB/Spo0J family partition protein [Spirochaetota bacterium]
MAKHGLGRGLGALIPESELEITVSPASGRNATVDEPVRAEAEASHGIRMVPLGRIRTSPDQPRKAFNEETLRELADSIARHGVIQPIVAEDDGSGGFVIIAGERRYRAAEKAGLREIPVIVRSFSHEKKLEIALVENVQREDLNPIEEAEAYRSLMDLTGSSQEEISEKVGKSRSAVANALRLLKLLPEAMSSVRSGTLSAGHARAVLSVLNPSDQVVLCRRIAEQELSVRQAEALAAELNNGGRASSAVHARKAPRPLQPEIAELEQRLIGYLGTKVTLKGDSRKGAITIEYFSLDDLERVIELMTNNRA